MSTTPAFEALELGDNVTDSFERKGSVVEVDRKLIVLHAHGTWKYAEDYIAEAKENHNPYRIERRDWDLDPYDVLGQAYEEFFANGGQIAEPVYEGTDLEPQV